MNIFNINEIMVETSVQGFRTLVKTLAQGDARVKKLLFADIIIGFIAITIAILIGTNTIIKQPWEAVALILLALSFIIFILITAYVSVIEKKIKADEITDLEKRARENPNETKAAWELAQIKLENYLNRNLSQVKWIFFWTIIIMLLGFGLITWGIVKVYQSNNNFNASIVATVTGIVIELIGASFLFVYKSTLQQAKEYVSVLERINVVGMSLQVIESIENNKDLKDQAKLDLSKQILTLYQNKNGI
jgi:glucan phosphoethanolaminetransferase (alkaline phosphatase superfamily)